MKISVVVPVYNVESYIEACVNSIINQTYSNVEIILVDDGSTDNSGLICDNFAEKDSRIKVIHTLNRGLSAARNEGIRNSSGDYIMFIDADDFITLNAVDDIVKKINEQKDVDIVVGKLIYYYNEQKQVAENFAFDQNRFHNKSGIDVLTYFFEEIPVIMWPAVRSIYRRKLLLDNQLYFTEGITSEDLDLIPRIYMCANKIAAYNDPFYYYRQLRPNSIINSINTKKFYDIVSIIKKYEIQLREGDYPDRFRNAFLMQLANIYARYIAILANIKKDERKDLVAEMKKIEHILVYAKGVRGRSISFFSRLLGFEIASILYLSIKRLKQAVNKFYR